MHASPCDPAMAHHIGNETTTPAAATPPSAPVAPVAPAPAAPVAEAAPTAPAPAPAPVVAAPAAVPVIFGREEKDMAPPQQPTKPVPVVTTSSTKVTAAPASDAHPDAEDPHQGALGPVRLGIFAGIGAPSVFSGEILFKVGDYVGLAGDYGVLPKLTMPLEGGGAQVQGSTMSGALRVYPLREAFFFGAALGQQSFSASENASAYGFSQASNFESKALFVEPQVGLMHRFSFGLALGCDLGVRFPVSSSATASAALPDTMSSLMNYTQKGVMPELNLLRIGYVL